MPSRSSRATKYNKKLGLFGRLAGSVISEDAVDPNTGEIIAEKDTRIDKETARTIENSGLDAIYVYAKKEGSEITFDLFLLSYEYRI